MVRRLLRLIGFLLLAASIVVAVIDGARFIGTDQLILLPLGTVIQESFGLSVAELARLRVPSLAPLVVRLLAVPAAPVIFFTGLVILWLGLPRAVRIGFESRA